MSTKNFKSGAGFKKAMAFIHMNIHKGPSKNPYAVKIEGRAHKVNHGTVKHNHITYKK